MHFVVVCQFQIYVLLLATISIFVLLFPMACHAGHLLGIEEQKVILICKPLDLWLTEYYEFPGSNDSHLICEHVQNRLMRSLTNL
jgi:hypothetical protein